MAPVADLRPEEYRFGVEREPLVRPFHFKGGFFTEKWLTVTSLRGAGAGWVTAIGGLAVLWSDPGLFFSRSETGGNLAMALLAEEGARRACGSAWSSPLEALQELQPDLHNYGRAITGRSDLRPTFILNALVSLDLALWMLRARALGTECFEELLPREFHPVLGCRHDRLLRVPLIAYNTPLEEVVKLAHGGHCLLKIKLGQAGSQEEMLQRDLDRLEKIHRAVGDLPAEHTDSGRVMYYLDANGRYAGLEPLLRLLEGADRLGLLERVAILEEPFPDGTEPDVSVLPVRLAADESLHGPEDVRRRIEQGYRAIALKPAGKTLSRSLEMALAAAQHGVPCFVADSACVPWLVEWNKAVAARLPAFPGLSLGIMESNGPQNYRRWSSMMEKLPQAGAGWLEAWQGVYRLEEEFYRSSGGIFRPGLAGGAGEKL